MTGPRRLSIPRRVAVTANEDGRPVTIDGRVVDAVRESWLVEDRWWIDRAIAGKNRDAICVVGAIGHDFYAGERDGAKGYPRFTDPRLREESQYVDYLRMATERSLERCGLQAFDLLLLHNPDRTGYTSEAVWNGMATLREAGLTRMIGIAPGPANGFTLD